MDRKEFEFAPLEIGFDDFFLALENPIECGTRDPSFLADFGDVNRVVVVLFKEGEEGVDDVVLGVGFHSSLRRKGSFCRK